jgi:glycosyltransferase involved in cell wall biosynthesis
MPTPLVSVIVPSYNYAASLAACLRAVAAQTYPAIEVVVVDDHSTDDSVAVASALGVRVIALPDNGGCGRARNVGVANTTGEILFFVDADVAMAPDAVAEAVAILEAEPQVGAVCGIEDPEPLLHDTLVSRYRGLQYHHWSASGEGNVTFLFPAMCAIRRRVYQEVGPFNPALKQTEEVDYGYRLSRRHQLRLTSRVRGRHDHDHQLLPLLRKLFHRARLRIPLYARARHFATGFEMSSGGWVSRAAPPPLPALMLPWWFGPLWLVLPAALVTASIVVDRQMYALTYRHRGPAFLLFFAVVHFLVNVTITAGVAAGAAQWLMSRPFRQLYDSTFPAEATA